MKQVTTPSGFSCTINEQQLDDMELLDMITAADDGNTLVLPKITTKLLGEENKKRLYDHLRNEEGRVPTAAFGAELAAIFEAMNDGKKS